MTAGAATHGRTAEQVPDDVGGQDGGVGEEEEMSNDLDGRLGGVWESGTGQEGLIELLMVVRRHWVSDGSMGGWGTDG